MTEEERKEKERARKKRYYETHREQYVEYRKKWKEENSEKYKEIYTKHNKKYREEHKEEIKAYQREYRKKNPEKMSQYDVKRYEQRYDYFHSPKFVERRKERQRIYNARNKEKYAEYEKERHELRKAENAVSKMYATQNGNPWTPEEDNILMEMLTQKEPRKAIALTLRRSNIAIASRIQRLRSKGVIE